MIEVSLSVPAKQQTVYLALAIAGCAPSVKSTPTPLPPAKAPVIGSATSKPAPPPQRIPPDASEVHARFTAAYTLRAQGDKAGAQKRFADLIPDLKWIAKDELERGLPFGEAELSSDGRFIAFGQVGGMLLFDAKTQQPLRWIDEPTASAKWIAGKDILLLQRYGQPRIAVYDASTGDLLVAFSEDQQHMVATDGSILYAVQHKPMSEGGDGVIAWDIATRKELGVMKMDDVKLGGIVAKLEGMPDPENRGLETLTLAPGGKTLVGAWGYQRNNCTLWDTKSRSVIASLRGGNFYGVPTFDDEGKLLAVIAVPEDPEKITNGVVALIDVAARKPLAVFDTCTFPTNIAFTHDGKSIAIGDLRRACVHSVATKKLLVKTDEVRAFAGPGDTLQDLIELRFVLGGTALTMGTADAFTRGLFALPSGKAIWKDGSTRAVYPTSAAVHFLTETTVVTIDAKKKIVTRTLTEAERENEKLVPELAFVHHTKEKDALAAAMAALATTMCHIGEFPLPPEVCP